MISDFLSRKIKVLTFVAIYLVLVIHSYIDNAETHHLFYFFQAFVGNYLARLFLPLFFILSGYLFYINIIRPKKSDWLTKYFKRFQSLVVPYVIWNLFFLMVMVSLYHFPITSSFINNNLNTYLSIGQFYKIFLLPINFPLWFIKHLIIIVLFTPFLYYLLKHIYLRFILISAFFITSFYFDIALSFLFFCVGAWFAIHKTNIEYRIKKSWLILFLLLTLISGVVLSMYDIIGTYTFYLSIFPLLLLWFGYDLLVHKGIEFKCLNKVLPFTFFIYVFHEPTLNIFKKLILFLGNNTEISYWLCYIFSPIIMVFFSFLIGKLWRKQFPKSFSIAVGKRV